MIGRVATTRQPDGAAGSGRPRSPVADPAAALSPTAKRILEAAHRVLSRDGLPGLTLDAISAESGANKSLIAYYFGSKGGLVAALIDWVDHDDTARLIGALTGEGAAGDAVTTLLDIERQGSKAVAAGQLFFDLLPYVLRDDALRARLGELYRWYRELDGWAFSKGAGEERDRRLEQLGALTVAVCDGLTIQYAADPSFDVDAVYDLWEHMVRALLRDLHGGRAEPAEAGS